MIDKNENLQITGYCNDCFRHFPFALNTTINKFYDSFNSEFENLKKCGYCNSTNIDYHVINNKNEEKTIIKNGEIVF